MKVNELGIWKEGVIFEADDLEDEAWNPIIEILTNNGYQVGYGDGNYMNFFRPVNKRKENNEGKNNHSKTR